MIEVQRMYVRIKVEIKITLFLVVNSVILYSLVFCVVFATRELEGLYTVSVQRRVGLAHVVVLVDVLTACDPCLE